jgi:serine/threonine protein kinase
MSEYQLVKVLGEGSYGVAKLCICDGKHVVVKTEKVANAYSRTEMLLLESLRHRHIVRYRGAWCERGLTSISMEYCEGGDLRHHIRQRRNHRYGFPERCLHQWMVQLASALHYCHIQHIIHRDLKAENVLIQGTTLKIADFGLSRSVDGTTDFAYTRVGTPQALPPEIYDHCPYNHRADMWCLGIILYELITLKRPFTGRDLQDILMSIKHDDPPDVAKHSREAYNDELYDLCRRLLSKNPKLRPSAYEILEMPWAKEYVPKDFDSQSDVLRHREQAAWARITVEAEHDKSTMHEVITSDLINVRDAPSLTANVLRRIRQGDVVEEVNRFQDPETGVVWYKLANGFCIREKAGDRRQLFRELPEWRVRRPGMACMPPPSTTSEAGAVATHQDVNNMLAQDFSAPKDRLAALLRFLNERDLPDSFLKELFDAHDACATPSDDAVWTYYCVRQLRPMRATQFMRILRVAAAIMADDAAP